MFTKGHKKFAGITKGQTHQKTKDWQAVGQYLTSNGVDRVLSILDHASDGEFMNYYTNLIRYFKPQLSNLAMKEIKETEGDQNELDPEQKKDLENAIGELTYSKLWEVLQGLDQTKTYTTSELSEIFREKHY